MIAHTKCSTLVLILLFAAITIATAQAASAALPKPSAPEFTAKFVDRSYDVPETSAVNQYTGQTEVTPAHRVQNYIIELTIKNQHITGGSDAEFHYDVNVKGHFAQNWTIMYPIAEGPKPSASDYTTITYELVSSPSQPEQGFELRSSFDDPVGSNAITQIPGNSQLDFQVRAFYGAMHRGVNPDATDPLSMYPWVFDGEISDWSTTQTVTLPPLDSEAPVPTASNPFYAPSVSGNTETIDLATVIIAASSAIVIAVVVAVLLVVRGARKQAAAIQK